MGEVYSITNVINGRVYIGATTKESNVRWKEHLSCVHKKPYCTRELYKDIDKYGKENFKINVLFSTDIENELFEKEKEQILQLQKEGYNLYNKSLGGKGRSSIATNEKEIISYYLFLSDFNTVETARYFRIDHGTVRKLLHKYHIQPLSVDETNKKRGHRIAQCELDKHKIIHIFNSVAEAAECLTGNKMRTSAIRHCLKGRNKTALGYFWKYV